MFDMLTAKRNGLTESNPAGPPKSQPAKKCLGMANFDLPNAHGRSNQVAFFDNKATVTSLEFRSQMTGNPVEIGDGCATVTDDNLPMRHCACSAGLKPGGACMGRRECGL